MTEELGRILQGLIIKYKSNLWHKFPDHKETELLLYTLEIRGDKFQNVDKNSSPDSRISVPTDTDYLLNIELSRKKYIYVHIVRFD